MKNKSINTQIGASVVKTKNKRNKLDSEFLGVDGDYTHLPINLKDMSGIDANPDWAKKVAAKVKEFKNKEGYKINENISDDTLLSQAQDIQYEANQEGAQALRLFNSIPSFARAALFGNVSNYAKGTYAKKDDTIYKTLASYEIANALGILAEANRRETKLRQKAQEKIDTAINSGSLESMNAIKNDWRTIDQKNQIQAEINRLSIIEEKQKKIDDLNNKLANAKTDEEKRAIANQISSLTGSVATQLGVPKGLIYFGVGIAVVVGIWVTIRAIRSN